MSATGTRLREGVLRGRTLRAHVARGTVINSVWITALGLLGLVKGFLLAGLLSPQDYGIWGILLISLGTLQWLKQVGVSERYVQQEADDQELAFQRAFTIEAVLNGALTVLVLASLPLLSAVYGRPELVLPGLVLCLLLPAVTLQAPFWVLYRDLEYGRQRRLQAIDPVVGFTATLVLALAGTGYWAFIGGALAGSWAAAIVAVASSPYPLRLRFDGPTAQDYLRFSGPIFVASIGGIIIAQGSILTAEHAAGLAAAGAITLAASVSQFTTRVDDVVSETLYPAICAVADRTELLFEAFVKSNRLALMWAMPFGLGLALFSPDLVAFALGARWTGAVELLQAFGLAAALGHVGFNWTTFLLARGQTRPIAVNSMVSLAVFLAVTVPLTLTSGLRGLAAGTLAVTAAGLGVRAVFLTRLFRGFAMGRHAVRAVASSLPALAVVLACRLAEGGGRRTAAMAAVEVALYCVATAAATWALERDLLREASRYVRSGTRAGNRVRAPAPL